jgi:hypothetical protein
MATNFRGDTLRVSIDTFNRIRCLNLRKRYKAANGQELPGKGGFALNVTRLLEFAGLVNKALRAASEAGLLQARVPPVDRSDALVEHPVPMVGYPHDQDWAIHHRGLEETHRLLAQADWDEVDALIRNPNIGDEKLEALYERTGPFSNLPEDRWCGLVSMSVTNTRLVTREDRIDGPDLGHFRIQKAILTLLEIAPIEPR